MAENENENEGVLIYTHHYDRDEEHNIEQSLINIIRTLQDYITRLSTTITEKQPDGTIVEKKVCPINDSILIAELQGIVADTITLLLKYKEFEYADSLKQFEEYLLSRKTFDAIELMQNVRTMRDIVAIILGAKHNFKDRTEREFAWEKEIKKKWHLSDLSEKDQQYFDKLKSRWKKLVFLATHNMVNCDGDVYALVTGINNGGKTNTSIAMLAYANYLLRKYWKVTTERFSLKKHVIYVPAPSDLDELLGEKMYNTIDLNEGMAAAVNLKSMDPLVIRLGVNAFITRSKHNFVIFEYQVASRVPKMLEERFNLWIHKMSKEWAVVSVPSSLYRKVDPLYLDELEKLRRDKEISYWFKYRNPNYIMTMRAPRLKPSIEEKFKKYQAEAHLKTKEAAEIKGMVSQNYWLLIKELWERINVENTLALVDLPRELREKAHLNDVQIKKFMSDYNKYDRERRLTEWLKGGLKAKEAEKSGVANAE